MRIRFSTDAHRDRREAQSHYAGVSFQARQAFQRDLQAALQYLLTYPLGAPAHSHDVRAKRLTHFPYTVLYRVSERSIFVLAVAPQARDPEYYTTRFD